MMGALMRISGMDKVPAMPADVQMMCIENSAPFFGLFSTHPPIQKRIAAISQTTNTPIPHLKPKIRADERERFQSPSYAGKEVWLPRTRFNRNSATLWQ